LKLNAKKVKEILPAYLKNMEISKEELEIAKRSLEIKVLKILESGHRAVFEIPLKINPGLKYDFSFYDYMMKLKSISIDEIQYLKDKLSSSLFYTVMVGNIEENFSLNQ